MHRASALLENRQRGWVNRAAVRGSGRKDSGRDRCLLTRPGTLHRAATHTPERRGREFQVLKTTGTIGHVSPLIRAASLGGGEGSDDRLLNELIRSHTHG